MTVRPARPDDVPALVAMAHELADYHRAAELCRLTDDQLRAALFGPAPAVSALVAVDASDQPIGSAVWYVTFSTWTGVPGIHLEELYVRPSRRGSGIGRLLLSALAAICVERGYARLDWAMLDWNPAAGFYRALGATTLDGQLSYRLAGPALHALAQAGSGAAPRLGPADPDGTPRLGQPDSGIGSKTR